MRRRSRYLLGSASWLSGVAPWAGSPSSMLAPLRIASAPDVMAVFSGHSLTDVFFQGGVWPGALHGLREAAFGSLMMEHTGKSTIPGSSTRIRWEAPAGSVSEVHARYDIADYSLMSITERGLDTIGVAPPYILDDAGAEMQIQEDMTYLWAFVNNARLNGNGGAGAESLLWAIWPAIDGSMGDFRSMLDEYEKRWHYRQELINHWLGEAGETQFPYMHVIPGHRLFARIYDDIQAGLVPGIASIQDLFTDNIHPNNWGAYAVCCLKFAGIWQQSPVGLSYQTDPAMSDALRSYFQTIAWEIVNDYARAGLGGSDMGAPGLLPASTDVDPSSIPGLLYATTDPIIMDGATINSVNLPVAGEPGSDLYVVLALNPSATQPKSAGNVFQLRTTAGENALSVTYRSDMDVLMLENSLTGGHAAHIYPEAMVTAQTPAIIEAWIDGTTGRLRGIGQPGSLTMTPATGAVTSIRFGTPDWGGEIMAGTIPGMLVYGRTPSDEERVSLRAWAYEKAHRPFPERAIPPLPAPL